MKRLSRLGLAAVACTVLVACSDKAPSSLDPQSPQARRIAGLWWLMFGMAAVVYVIVAGFIVIAATRGRRRGEAREGRHSDERFIWLGGIVAPVAILAVLAVATVDSSKAVVRPGRDPLRVEVIGERWWWAVRYPGSGVTTANEIHIPVGRPVHVRLYSDDVIHSFWVPELGGKVDMLPDHWTETTFTATAPGEYRGMCAEYCGLQHANMNFVVRADPAADFERWLVRRRNPPPGPSSEMEAFGQATFVRSSCAGCHTIRGTDALGTLGPDLSDFGSRTSIGAKAVPNDPTRLAGWIADPHSIKPGALMPPSSLSADELNAVVAYLESLK